MKHGIPLNVAILGDNNESRPPRRSIVPALQEAADQLGCHVVATWMDDASIPSQQLDTVDGFFIAPGGPDEDHNHILTAIQYAREQGVPVLGTCGGMQRILTEFAYNVLNYDSVLHQEIHHSSDNAFFTALSCGIYESLGDVYIQPQTKAHRAYNNDQTQESYYCRFGLNPEVLPPLSQAGWIVSGRDRDGNPRIMELQNHPFFIGTLFVPQIQSSQGNPHPVIEHFIKMLHSELD